MQRTIGIFAGALLFFGSASIAASQNVPQDQDTRIRRAASSAENALAVRECVREATVLRDIAEAARAEPRGVVRAALLESLDNRSRALAACRDAMTPRTARGRMLQVRGAESESGFGQMSLSPLLVQFTEHEADFIACYERSLRNHIGTSGHVSIVLRVRDGSGEVDHVESVENTFTDPNVADCVARVVRGFHAMTPGPVGGDITYRFPIEFEPGY